MEQLTLKDKQTMWALAWQESRDERAMKSLVDSCKGLVHKQATPTAAWSGISREDLVSEGLAGIVHAANVYDPEKGQFSGCAYEWIRSYVQRHAQQNWSQMTIAKGEKERRLQQEISGLVVSYENEGWSGPRAVELAARDLGVSPEHAARAMNLRNGRKTLASESSDSEEETGVQLVSECESAEDAVDRATVNELIEGLLNKLDDRERYVLKRRYFLETKMSLENIAVELGVSRTWVTELEKQALRYLAIELRNMGLKIEDLI